MNDDNKRNKNKKSKKKKRKREREKKNRKSRVHVVKVSKYTTSKELKSNLPLRTTEGEREKCKYLTETC